MQNGDKAISEILEYKLGLEKVVIELFWENCNLPKNVSS